MNTMPGPSNGGRSGSVTKKKDGKLVDNIRGACPPHRRKDLDALIKLLNGDEAKIQAKIQEWWEEPQEEEEELWKDVNKRGSQKAKLQQQQQRAPLVNSRGGSGRAPGRGVRSSRGAGGRGGKDAARGGREGRGARDGSERRPGGRGRGSRYQERDVDNIPPGEDTVPLPEEDAASHVSAVAVDNATVPAAPKGAWSVRATGAAAELNAAPIPEATKQVRPAPQATPEPIISMLPPPVESRPADLTANHLDPGLPALLDHPKPVKAPSSTSGNVWATKGSAHLIQAEKPKPPPPPAPLPSPPTTHVEQPLAVVAPLQPSLPPEPVIETVLVPPPPPPTTSVPAWSSPVKPPKPTVELPASPMLPASPIVSQPPLTSIPPASVAVEETIVPSPAPIIEEPAAPKVVVKAPAVSLPTTVLNMGHWETGEEDSQHIDFGFGFDPDHDVAIMDSTTAGAINSSVASTESAPAAASSAAAHSAPPAMSPARPPPGLSISGMPPIPPNAVLVHELENSLENTSLNPQPEHSIPPSVAERSMPNTIPSVTNAAMISSQPHQSASAPVLPQQNYGQYSMASMYSGYGAAGNGFMGVHAPVLAGGVIPPKPQQPPSAGALSGQQQQQQQVGSGLGIPLAQPQHSGLYGSAGPSSAGSSQVGVDNDTSAATPIPPSIPGGGMPYNPVYYGQQPFHHMGQPQGGIGYNYGYGAAQFGGAGGFGYQQVMGQSGGYHAAAPPYDDQTHPGAGSHHAGSAGGYQKTTGYRGRSSHHSGSQYQNQYNPPSGYGAQPAYGMGYGVDHFGQRGVSYGPQDPYMQPQQQQQSNAGAYPSSGIHRGNFPDEEQYKKKGGRNNNGSNLQQFPPQQQHGPSATPAHLSGQQQQQQQHSFGLSQSGAAQNADTGSSTGGWPNHHGGGSWGGGVPSWQGS